MDDVKEIRKFCIEVAERSLGALTAETAIKEAKLLETYIWSAWDKKTELESSVSRGKS